MKKILMITLACLALSPIGHVFAKGVDLPIRLAYPLLAKALDGLFYTSEGHSAELWHDQQHCSHLRLADPRISQQSGQLRILNNVNAHIGAMLGGHCVALMQWHGTLETLQKPTLSKDRLVLSLPVTQATTYDQQGHALKIDQLEALLDRQAKPWLAQLQINLNQARGNIIQTIAPYLPPERVPVLTSSVESLVFTQVETNSTGIVMGVNFKVPKTVAALTPEAPLTGVELAQWQKLWDKWHESYLQAISHTPPDRLSPALQSALIDQLARAQSAFQAGLAQYNPGQADPVRVFFSDAWQQLSPLLSNATDGLPELDSLHALSLIAATDLLYALESRMTPFGLSLSSDSLRRLARTLLSKDQHAAAKI